MNKKQREQLIGILSNSGHTAIDIAKAILLPRSKLNWNWKLQPEQKLCVDIADMLRLASDKGRYTGIWGHIANEGLRSEIVACILNAMGMLAGQPDYFFMGPWGCGVIEIKVPGNVLEKTQQYYATWCEHGGVKYSVCKSVFDVEEILKSWGALAP